MAGLQEKDTISLTDAKVMLAAMRESQPSVSQAASVLGKAAAAKRAEAPKTAPQAADKPINQPQAPAQQDTPDEEENADENADLSAEGEDVAGEQPTAEAETTEDQTGDEPTIEVDGKVYTAEDIRGSYLRRDDYTRKTQEVATQKSALDQRANALIERETQSLKQLDALLAFASNLIGQEPNWAEVAGRVDPQTYNQMRAQWDTQQKGYQLLVQNRQQMETQNLQAAKTAMWQELRSDYKPEWKDQAKFDTDIRKLADFAISVGITPQELQFVSRTPYMKILDMAFQHAEAQKNVATVNKRVIGKPKPVRPGMQRGRIDGATQAWQTAQSEWENSSHSTKDAQRYLAAKNAARAAGVRVQ